MWDFNPAEPQMHVFVNTHLAKGDLSLSGVLKSTPDSPLIPTTAQLVYKLFLFFNKSVLK